MQISEFLTGYSNIINETYTKKEIDVFFQKMIPLTKDTSSEIQCYIADSTLEKVLAIDDIAYKFMGREADLLGQMFPESDETDVQNQLFFLTGKNITELQKGSRKYFAPILSGLDFLTKQVGKTTKEDISKELNSYNILFEAQMKDPNTIILSNAELITLYRALKDQKYKALMDERGLDESSDDNPLVVAGYGSVELVDREGHLITLNALRKSFVKFMKNFRMRNCMYLHTDVQVGWPLPVYINKHNEIFKSGVDDKGLYLITEVSPEGKISEKVRDGIIKGELKSYSIAGSALKKQIMTKGSQTFMQVDDLELSEYTLCLPENEKIWTRQGLKNIQDITTNDYVFSHLGKWRKVTKTMNRFVDEELIKIITEDGSLSATSNHPVRALRYEGQHKGTHYKWVAIGELEVGDLISYHEHIKSCKICGTPIFSNTWPGEKTQYCSKKCRYKDEGNRKGCTIASGDAGAISQSKKTKGITKKENPRLTGGIRTKEGRDITTAGHRTSEYRKKRSDSQKALWKKEDYRKTQSAASAKVRRRPENRELASKRFKEMWKNEEIVRKILSSWSRTPNKLEIQLSEFLDSHFPGEWKFVGDGSIWIGGKNPDFINVNGKKKIIEFNGEFWHQDAEKTQSRIEKFKEYGYDTLIITDNEFKESEKHCLNRVKEFCGNKLSRIIAVERKPYSGVVYNLSVEEDESYTTEFAVVHNCTQGVNQDSKFDIMKAIKNEKDSLDNTNRDDPLMDGLDIPTVTEEITRSVAKSIGNKIGADWNKYTPSEFAKGLNAEMGQKDVTQQDLFSIARLALSNLEDAPKYYSLLSGKLEKSLASKSALDIRESSSDYNYDASALREAIIAEYDATNLYEQMAEKTKDEKLKALLLDIANEEKVHIGEFEAKLAEIDEEHEGAVEEGEEEAKDVMKSAIDRFSSFMKERK